MAVPSSARRQTATRRVVAIEIATSSVRAVEVELSAAGARALKHGEAALDPRLLDDAAANRVAIGQAIRSALGAAGIAANEVVVALPRRLVTVKLARLPHAEPEQIQGMVQFEAQQYVPFPLDEVVLGHEIVSDDGDEMSHVMIAAARRSLVEGILAACDAASLEVVRITVSSFGLAEHARGSVAPVALLGLDHDAMDLAVVVDGHMVFSRAAALPATADEDTQARSLAMEIGRSLAAYQNENRSHPVSSVLVGGGAGPPWRRLSPAF